MSELMNAVKALRDNNTKMIGATNWNHALDQALALISQHESKQQEVLRGVLVKCQRAFASCFTVEKTTGRLKQVYDEALMLEAEDALASLSQLISQNEGKDHDGK